MKTLNRVQLIGSLGGDPKIYAMASGTLVARFSMATQYVTKDKETKILKKDTEWHSIVLLGNVAKIAELYLQRGTCIYVEGSLKTREYEDAEKNTRKVIEIAGNDVIVLSNGKEQPIISDSDLKAKFEKLKGDVNEADHKST